ncbi:hypothetical protein QFC22_006134 [Naganishia vaughanmartiniae]|uniref:Uncharacterized protein n=1 Tax=Naganishia vaughanmartiniae TaxID=1424756 RepID=A0ACC2WNJ7_9TREE|nr:hypothetical protein QFC22_006134 [Naganishia vaughanmartiniae]
MAWRLADPYGVQSQAYQLQGQGNWWEPQQPGIGATGTGDDASYVGSPLSAGFGRSLLGGSSTQHQQQYPVQYQQQKQHQATTADDSAEPAVADPLREISYQSVLNCFTLNYLNSHHQSKQLLARLLPTLPINPGVHTHDPAAPPTGPSAANANGRSRSRDRVERNRFRSVAEAEQYRASQLANKVGVDPRFDWDAFPATVGWRNRGQVRSFDGVAQGRSRIEARDGSASAGSDDGSYSPEDLQLDEPQSFLGGARTSTHINASDVATSADTSSGRRRLSDDDLQRIRANADEARRRNGGPSDRSLNDDHDMHQHQDADSHSPPRPSSGPSVSPTTIRSKSKHPPPKLGPLKKVKFRRDLERAGTAPTIKSRWGPYCIWAESEDVLAAREAADEEEAWRVKTEELRAKEERDAMDAAGLGLRNGEKRTGKEKSRYNPKARAGESNSLHNRDTTTYDPRISRWLAPAVDFPLSSFQGLVFGFSYSSNAFTSNEGARSAIREPSKPAHKEKQPVKAALSKVVRRWDWRRVFGNLGNLVGDATQGTMNWLRGASVGAPAAITAPADNVAERASVNAESSMAGAAAREAAGINDARRVPQREDESVSAVNRFFVAWMLTRVMVHLQLRVQASTTNVPSLDRRREQEHSTTTTPRYEREEHAEADGDRFYRVPVSRQRESSESSEDGFVTHSRRPTRRRHGENDEDNDRGRNDSRRAVEERRSGSWSSGESLSPDRRPRPKAPTVVLTLTGDRRLDGSPPRARQDVLNVQPADNQEYDDYGDDEFEEDPAPILDLPAIGTAASKPVTRDNTAFNAFEEDFVPLEDDKMGQGHGIASSPPARNRLDRANQRWQTGYSDTNAYFRSLSSLSDDRGRGRRRDRYVHATAGDSWINDESDTDSEEERRRSGRVRLRSPPPDPSLIRKPQDGDGQAGAGTGKAPAAKSEVIDDEDDMDDTDEKTLHSWEAKLHATLQTFTKRYEVPEYDDETNSEDENPDFAGIEEDSEAEMRVEAEEVPELGMKPLYGTGFNKDRTLPKFARHKLKDFKDRHRGRDHGNRDRHYDGQNRYQPYRRR